jgi:hypothetical protein
MRARIDQAEFKEKQDLVRKWNLLNIEDYNISYSIPSCS